MKQAFLSLLMATLAFVGAKAQQIAVVSESGTTTLYRTLQAAIEGAEGGSVVYLPGGGFAISDDVKITKKLTIIGIGYKANGENVDGSTTIAGNLFFYGGSDGSAVIGCYISGNVNIGLDSAVHDITIKYCNLNSVQVLNNGCSGTFISRNYLREASNFTDSEVTIKNNIINTLSNISTGVISYNVCCHECGGNPRYGQYWRSLDNVNNTAIVGNIFRGGSLAYFSFFHTGESCTFSNNLFMGSSVGENPIIIDASAEDIFDNVNSWNISPTSDFHFTDAYKQYESQCGIYAGTGFDDSALPPVPYIVSKAIADRTDAAGKLKINIRVKASE